MGCGGMGNGVDEMLYEVTRERGDCWTCATHGSHTATVCLHWSTSGMTRRRKRVGCHEQYSMQTENAARVLS